MPSKLILSLALLCFSLACHGGGGVINASKLPKEPNPTRANSYDSLVDELSEPMQTDARPYMFAGVSSRQAGDGISNGNVLYTKQLFTAKCDFGRFGNLEINEWKKTIADINDNRYLNITGTINNLCPQSSYTLSFNIYDNILEKCTNVGSTLGGPLGIVNSDFTNPQGTWPISFQKQGLVVLPSVLDKVYIAGGSCVVRINGRGGACEACRSPGWCGCRAQTESSYHPFYDQCCRPCCPSIICASVVMVPAKSTTTGFVETP